MGSAPSFILDVAQQRLDPNGKVLEVHSLSSPYPLPTLEVKGLVRKRRTEGLKSGLRPAKMVGTS